MSEYFASDDREDIRLVTWEAEREPRLPEKLADKLAEQLRGNPRQKQHLDTFKQFLIGSGDRTERLGGRRPWPSREINDETWRYTIPVFAGFSDENNILTVLKDPWHDHRDTSDWLVGQLELDSGSYTEYMVTAIRADARNTVTLQIADPSQYYNWPPGMRPGPDQPVRNWHRISLQLDENYLTDEAEIRYGMSGAAQPFYDIEHLHLTLQATEVELATIGQITTKEDILARLALIQAVAA